MTIRDHHDWEGNLSRDGWPSLWEDETIWDRIRSWFARLSERRRARRSW